MNLVKSNFGSQSAGLRRYARPLGELALTTALGLVLSVGSLSAQVSVETLGGGPITPGGPANGFANGNSMDESQFNSPYGCALDSAENLYIADRDNGVIRKLNFGTDRVSTYLTGFNQPVALVFDPGNTLYVASQGDGTVRKFDRFGNPIAVFGGFTGLTAITLDGQTNVFVTEISGTVKRISPAGAVTVIKTGLAQARGIAIMNDGSIAVSEDHAIRLINPITQDITFLSGASTPGFTNGPAELAKFNTPHHIAKAPNGTLVVADRLNHRVRLVDTNGITTTLYGVRPEEWISDFAGWEDGDVEFAEAREPIGVAVGSDGKVYTTEVFYHLVRAASGAGLDSAGGNGGNGGNGGDGGGTNAVVRLVSPAINPSSGYLPMGGMVAVSSQYPDVFFTVDGTEPTTNSLRLLTTTTNQFGGAEWKGLVAWHDGLRDLTSLRVRAYKGTNYSEVVSGQPAHANTIGVERDMVAGIGSTVVFPIVATLRTNDLLRSLQFRVEVSPGSPQAPSLTSDIKALSISSNDFVSVTGASAPGTIGHYEASPYRNGNVNGLVISSIGTNANMRVERFGAVAMLSVTVPSNANLGDTYKIEILEVSGTSDGQQTPVIISPAASRTITVTNLSYVVGDSGFGGWYNAGDFGDGNLDNSDVNNAFYASLGVRTPYNFTDAFDAMDMFPDDIPGAVGGDGQIRFLDWQRLLNRSLRRDTNYWIRSWDVGGIRTSRPTVLQSRAGNSPTAPQEEQSDPTTSWFRPALLGGGWVGGVRPESTVEIPVYVNVKPGKSLAGMQFRAAIETDGPAIVGRPEFIPAPGIPNPKPGPDLPNEVAVAWSLVPSPSFVPALEGSNVLGYIRFQVPVTAQFEQRFTLRFLRADGSPDDQTQYDLETLPGSAWVGTNPAQRPDNISDEWKSTFFRTTSNPLAQGNMDADGDGVPNWQEFLDGSNPTKLRLFTPEPDWANGEFKGLKLRWFASAGKRYLLECSPDVNADTWTIIASNVNGEADIKEVVDSNLHHATQFYRVRVHP
jgi:hypothetical protein